MERAGKILAKIKNSDTISPEELALAAWLATVGKRIAAKASPKALVRGYLIVETEDAIWQKQLFHLRYDILAKLTRDSGGGIVTGSGISHRARPGVRRNSAQSHSDTAVLDEADSIKDPVLRIIYKQARKKATA